MPTVDRLTQCLIMQTMERTVCFGAASDVISLPGNENRQIYVIMLCMSGTSLNLFFSVVCGIYLKGIGQHFCAFFFSEY